VRSTIAIVLAVLAGATWAADARYRGRFYWGPDVQVFEPCTELKAYWVDGDDKALKPLVARSAKLAEKRDKAHLPMYVELMGRIDTKSKREGPAEDYDGLLHVRKVLRASTAIPKRCRE
jgi:hypothetical protein